MCAYSPLREEREGAPLAQAALAVGRADEREVDDALPRKGAAAAEINIVEKEEIPWIETAELLVEEVSQQQACSHDPIDIAHGLRIHVPLNVAVHGRWKEPLENRAFEEDSRYRREAAKRVADASVGVDELWCEDANVWMLLHLRDHALEPTWFELVIGVDDEEVLAVCMANAECIPLAVPEISPCLDNPHARFIAEAVAE